jgi:hypothetical protein
MNSTPAQNPADAALLALLQRVTDQVDPVPELSYDLARATFGLRDLDSQLAALMHDSALEAGDLVRRGGDADVRLLSYEAGDLMVELLVSASGANRIILGEVTGGEVERIAVQTDGPGVEVQPDERGRFRLADLPAGPFRLRLLMADGRTITTSWVRA